MYRFLPTVCAALLLFLAPVTGRAAANGTPSPAARDLRGAIVHLLRSSEAASEAAGTPPAELVPLIAASQPDSGLILLSLIGSSSAPLQTRAIKVFLQSWDTMDPHQIKAYLYRILFLRIDPRPEGYPQNVDAGIRCQYGTSFDGDAWPHWWKFKDVVTRTTHYVDGHISGEPFDYTGSQAVTGWLSTRALARGQHSACMETGFFFPFHGSYYGGILRSPPTAFRILAANSPNTLAAPATRELETTFRDAFRIADTEAELNDAPPSPTPPDDTSSWEPNGAVWRTAHPEAYYSLHTPVYRIPRQLPVDLCFEVTVVDVQSGRTYAGDRLWIRQKEDTPGRGHFGLSDPYQFAAEHPNATEGVPVRLILKPSRSLALSMPETRRYYPGSLTTGILHIRVRKEDGPPHRVKIKPVGTQPQGVNSGACTMP